MASTLSSWSTSTRTPSRACDRQFDGHGDMGHADVELRLPGYVPTEPLEERHVARLDLRRHEAATGARGRGNGETHQRHTEAVTASAGEHGEPIALPVARIVEGIEPHRAPCDVAAEPQHLDRGGGVVAPIAIGVPEQSLLADEHLCADAVVLRHHPGVGGDAAGHAGAVQDVSHWLRRACARSGVGLAPGPWASTLGIASNQPWPSPHRGRARPGTALPGARPVRRSRAEVATTRP